MIRNNLLKLLSERELKATRVSSDTGIARSTLSLLTNNDSKMVQLETVNTLCRYLNVTPADFFEYLPFDVEFKCFINEISLEDTSTSANPFDVSFISNNFQADGYLSKITDRGKQTFGISLTYNLDNNKQGFVIDKFDTSDIQFNVDVQTDQNSLNFTSFWNNELTVGFQTELRKTIMDTVHTAWKSKVSDAIGDTFDIAVNKSKAHFTFHF